jgi:hypothetical protein
MVRQAIAYAIDADFITHYLHDSRSIRAKGPIAPNSPFYEDDLPGYDCDLEKARDLLDRAGYPVASTSYRFSLTCDYIPVVPSQQRDIVLYLKRQLKKVGIDVQVRRSDTVLQWAKRISQWDFDMTMDSVFNWADPMIGVHRTYMSDNIRKGIIWSNTQNYHNPEVDDLLRKAALELDLEKRKQLYSKFQKLVTRDLPLLFINVTPLHTIYDSRLHLLHTSIWGLLSPFDSIYWNERPKPRDIYNKVNDSTNESHQLSGQEDAIPGEAWAKAQLRKTSEQAVILIREKGLYKAYDELHDPSHGFLDLETSGLHVIGFTRHGKVFLDNSQQMKSGMDISNIIDKNGDKIIPQLLQAAEERRLVMIERVWPHPGTHEIGPLAIWCGNLSDSDIICALCWSNRDSRDK